MHIATELTRAIAPITQGVHDVHTLFPRQTSQDFSARVGDYVSAQDELERQKKEKNKPLWARLVLSTALGATIGGGLGGLKSVPIEQRFDPRVAGTMAVVGGLGAGGFTLARHILGETLAERAQNRINTADEGVKYVARSPKTREEAKGWERSQWAPYVGTEAGAVAGGLGALAAKWVFGRQGDVGSTIALGAGGAVAGGVLGHLIGKYIKKKKHKEFLEHVNQQLADKKSPKAQEAVSHVGVEQEPMLKAAVDGTAVGPLVASNGPLMRGIGGPAQMMTSKGGAVLYGEYGSMPSPPSVSPMKRYSAGDKLEDPKKVEETTNDLYEKARYKFFDFKKLSEDDEVKEICQAIEKVAADNRKMRKVAMETGSGKKLRKRSEVVISNGEGILAIKKDGYLLLPGGGVNEGESDEEAVKRETGEEAGRELKDLRKQEKVEALFDPDNIISEGFDGESTQLFSASDAGHVNTMHEDRENFKFIDFDKAAEFLVDCLLDKKNQWCLATNRARLDLILGLKAEALGIPHTLPDAAKEFDKTADVAAFAPRAEVLMFTPEGKLVIKRRKDNRRFDLPDTAEGSQPVPYEQPISYIPSAGVPEVGVHGYKVNLRTATGQAPEGYEAVEPDAALKDLYASLGQPQHQEYQALDRGRARAILRLIKRRKVNESIAQG